MASSTPPSPLFAALPDGLNAIGSIAGAYAQARAQGLQADWQKFQYGQQRWAADQNRQFSELMAEDAIRRGDRAAIEHTKKVRQLVGSQRAALAAQGIDVNSGSAMDTQLDAATLGAYDVETIKNNAWREAWGLKVQAGQYSSQAAMAGISSNLAGISGGFQQASTYLTGGLSALGSGLKGYAAYKDASRPAETKYTPTRG